MANIYREEIEKQKKTLREYYGYSEDGAADLVIELICQLSIAEGKRQQHEKDVLGIAEEGLAILNSGIKHSESRVIHRLVKTLSSLTPRESGE